MESQQSYEELLQTIKKLEFELAEKNKIITELKQYEDVDIKKLEKELIKSKEKIQNSDKLKTAFLANMSHTIRTPMNAIIGFSELIAMEHISPKRKEDYIKIINEKGHQLLSLIDDLIEISRIEEKKIDLNFSSILLEELLNEIYLNVLQQKIKTGKEQVELILQKLPTNDNLQIHTDPGRLQQLFNIFLSFSLYNTIKGTVEFGYNLKDNKFIEFYIKDTGIGFTKDELKLLFDYFWHFEDISHQKLATTGLGLTLAKRIIDLLGGKISVNSEPNIGTTIIFNLPFEKSSRVKYDSKNIISETSVEYELEPNWKNKVILVVEDDEINFQFIEALVEKTQAQLLHAYNGNQALELCKSINKIDVILMDIKLPEKSGFDVTKEIKEIRNDIPIIAHSAFTLSEIKEKCFEAGCSDILTKPLEIPLFFSKMNKFLQ